MFDEAIAALAAMTTTDISPEQRNALANVCRRFGLAVAADTNGITDTNYSGRSVGNAAANSTASANGNADSDDEADNDADEGSGGEAESIGQKRKRQKKNTRGPRSWTPILNLKELRLDDDTRAVLRDCGSAPVHFLNDREALRHVSTSEAPMNATDALMGNFVYTKQVQKLGGLNTVRFGYCILGMSDFVRRLWPRHKSGRIGPKMKKHFREMHSEFAAGLTMPVDEFLEQISRWSIYGRKLDMVCAEFGDGCLFFLHGILSPDFLGDKCPMTGKYHQKAFEHLHRLGLRERVAFEHVNELGTNIRLAFRNPFHTLRPMEDTARR